MELMALDLPPNLMQILAGLIVQEFQFIFTFLATQSILVSSQVSNPCNFHGSSNYEKKIQRIEHLHPVYEITHLRGVY